MISIFPFAVAIDRRSNAVVINADSSPINPETPAITDRITLISVGADRALTLGDSKVDRVVLSLNHRPGELPDWVWSDGDPITPVYAFVPFAREVCLHMYQPKIVESLYGEIGRTIINAMQKKLELHNQSVQNYGRLVLFRIAGGRHCRYFLTDIDNRMIVDSIESLSANLVAELIRDWPELRGILPIFTAARTRADQPAMCEYIGRADYRYSICEKICKTLTEEFKTPNRLHKYMYSVLLSDGFSYLIKFM